MIKINFGYHLNVPCNFDLEYYVARYPDLKKAGIDSKEKATHHWINYGKHENRICSYDVSKEKKKKKKQIKNKTNPFDDNPFDEKFYKKTNYNIKLDFLPKINSKVYLSYINNDYTKGINLDIEIIKNGLIKIGFSDIEYLDLSSNDFEMLSTSDHLSNKIPLDREYYIFSEVFLSSLFKYLLRNNKKVIFVPNIDSYSTNVRELNWFDEIKSCNKYGNFYIWSKTKQIYNWINSFTKMNNYYINFRFYYNIDKIHDEKSFQIKPLKINNEILLDTGASTSGRKYINEIIEIFTKNPDIPFKLVVKTLPNVFQHKNHNLKMYEQYSNIKIISQEMNLKDLDILYSKYNYFIYISKFDGYGLSLAKAIAHNMFIICGDGLPWNELLTHYPRKCLIDMEQDFSKSMGTDTRGYARSQIYYKCDFNHLMSILKNEENKTNFEKIINSTVYKTFFFNWINNSIFLSNLYHFFNKCIQLKFHNYYENSSIYLCSYKDRATILIENLYSILFQSSNIYIYLNNYHAYTKYFLELMNNVTIIPFNKDLKAVSKLYCFCQTDKTFKYNFIIDDDIVYPQDYIKHSIETYLHNNYTDLLSYNGFTEKYKLSFVKKHINTKLNLKKIGTGTTFFQNGVINKVNLYNFIEKSTNNKNFSIMADKLLSEFSEKNKINMIYTNPKHIGWMINNSKISFNEIPGLFELKKSNNLIESHFLSCDIDENISCIKVLFAFKDTDKLVKFKHVENLEKIKKLKSYFYIYLIRYEELNLIPLNFYDYLITDTYKDNLILTQVINLKNHTLNYNVSLNDFIGSI